MIFHEQLLLIKISTKYRDLSQCIKPSFLKTFKTFLPIDRNKKNLLKSYEV